MKKHDEVKSDPLWVVWLVLALALLGFGVPIMDAVGRGLDARAVGHVQVLPFGQNPCVQWVQMVDGVEVHRPCPADWSRYERVYGPFVPQYEIQSDIARAK